MGGEAKIELIWPSSI